MIFAQADKGFTLRCLEVLGVHHGQPGTCEDGRM
jgi:hypothetical protein